MEAAAVRLEDPYEALFPKATLPVPKSVWSLDTGPVVRSVTDIVTDVVESQERYWDEVARFSKTVGLLKQNRTQRERSYHSPTYLAYV